MVQDLSCSLASEACDVLLDELEKKRPWVRGLPQRRGTCGASVQLLSELRFDDPAKYRSRNSFRTLKQHFRVSKAALSRFIPDVCNALNECLSKYIKLSLQQSVRIETLTSNAVIRDQQIGSFYCEENAIVYESCSLVKFPVHVTP
ncbi:hypothetical protein PR048_019695 [Dryococelus australis]|uniref:Uncharacterized protein n=1 Tax=Dryococelus australis TaxID=614101 RepID=A0ABQ9H466_9NEOP|nr:hypothetical protein PR048_019695 [Dryococelus australis]